VVCFFAFATHERFGPTLSSQVSKKKSSNPVLQQRKAEKAKQLARNKHERQMQREAMQHVDDPAYLRQQLRELLDEEEASGMLNAAQRSKKKTLQAAYEAALKKQMHGEAEKKKRQEAVGAAGLGAPVLDVSQIPLPSMPPPPGMNAKMERLPVLPPPLAPPPQQRQTYTAKTASGAGSGSVISGASTVVALPKAHHDVALTSMVPSTVVRRPFTAVSAGMRPRVVDQARTGKDKVAVEEVPDNLDDFLKMIND
jgi:hypothetical protein